METKLLCFLVFLKCEPDFYTKNKKNYPVFYDLLKNVGQT
jgi:hypothetical protein